MVISDFPFTDLNGQMRTMMKRNNRITVRLALRSQEAEREFFGSDGENDIENRSPSLFAEQVDEAIVGRLDETMSTAMVYYHQGL